MDAKNQQRLVEKFQCPGCACGCDIMCGEYRWDDDGLRCAGHVLGTMLGLGNSIALGLPVGFCKPGTDWQRDPPRAYNRIHVRLWGSGEAPAWSHYNVAVWALEQKGFLFVRTYSPRTNMAWVDVIEGGTLAQVPNAIDVRQFVGAMD